MNRLLQWVLAATLVSGASVFTACSNQSYASKVEALEAQLRGKDGADEAMAFIQAMVGVSRENFEATLDLIDQRYGSLSTYIENQLGFSKEEQQQLRVKYLTN